MSTLKLDAFVNIMGALFGMIVAAEVIPSIYDWWTSSLIGTRTTTPEYFGISEGWVGFLVILMVLMVLAMFAGSEFSGSEFAEKKFGEKEEES